jgi:hypothetical protein
MEDRKHIIIEFICKVTRKKQIQIDEDIFEGGIVNSLFAMQLVLFLEKKFGIRISGKDLKQINFRTVNAIDNFIDTKLQEN